MIPGGFSGVLFFFVVFISLCHVVHSACYFPDGSITLQDTPCGDNATHSACCGQGYACLSNKICMATGEELQKPGATVFVRGGCTDPDWRSSACPLFCINPDTPAGDNTQGGMGVGKCPGENLFFCINSAGHDCDSRQNVLIFPGTVSTLTTIGVGANPTTSLPSTNTSTSMVSSATTKISSSESADESRQLPEPGDGQDESKSKVPVGVGVGVGVVVLGAITALILWIWWRRRRQHQPKPDGSAETSEIFPGTAREAAGTFDATRKAAKLEPGHGHDVNSNLTHSIPVELPAVSKPT